MPEQSDSEIPTTRPSVDVRQARSPVLPFDPDGDEEAVISSLDAQPELIEAADQVARGDREGYKAPAAPAADEPDEPNSVLVVQSPGATIETRRPIDSPRFLVGRDNCDLELEDRFVSRWHVQLFRRDGALVLQDLDSRNGVYLRIADDLALEDGDQIVIGNQRLEFRAKWDEPRTRRADDDADVLGSSPGGSPVRLIRYLEGDRIHGIYPLLSDQTSIGASDCDINCLEDTLLSSPHVTIWRDGDRFILRDNSSEWGTFIRIANAVELIDGDCFLVGRTKIRLTLPS